ncbi:hypothetical protein AAFF_G00337670 [Aldrovandia affinis]|uniref:Uncharacterized protein n=1 Tax=Aldrovandia affinis TaxID=143900 RepID=A0AAD7SL97_9TELE|nr:hypothetical protein AAFF_G00337670 [Aldrovandia affinis]
MKAINLDTYSLSLLTAKEDILNPRSSTNWALFTYDGITNNLKLSDSGVGGVSELVGKLHIKRPLYGLCRVAPDGSGPSRIMMISWVGEEVDEYRRTECASHVPAVKAFFKEAHVFVKASRPEEVTEERIRAIISKISVLTDRVRRSSQPVDKEETVGTNYKRTIAAMEMRRINRDTFWACAEREEENRKEDERRRAIEDRRRRERERIQQERREAEERERKMNEKEQLIQEQRRIQAKIDAEARKHEKSRWELQQREHEEEMRARFRHSESIEKAAEAAALVSQRSINPREFFRQLSASSSRTPSNPGSPRTVRPPFRRYQRSLTDTAFIFGRSDSSTPTSPRSPTVVSPFSRTPTSPSHGSLSPPSPGCSDPTFRPITSPHGSHARPVSPSGSPQRPAPTSSLPSLPPSRPLPPLSPRSQAPSSPRAPGVPELPALAPAPSAPPASPGLLIAGLPQTQPSSLSPPTPLEVPVEAPTTPFPEKSGVTPLQEILEPEGHKPSSRIPSSQVTPVDTGIIPVVEEEEEEEGEEDEEEEEKAEPGSQAPETATASAVEDRSPMVDFRLSAPAPPAIDAAAEGMLPVRDSSSSAEEDLESEAEPRGEPTAEDGDENEAEEEEEGRGHSAPLKDEGVAVEAVCHPHQESGATGEVIDGGHIPQSAPHEPHSLSPNEMCSEEGGREENGLSSEPRGTGQFLSPSEMDEDSGLTPCSTKHGGTEEDFSIEKQEEKAENGEESSLDTDGQLLVRALYDYQAEDESELSLEPGDIISSVKAVDKAWWRGCSKDGRQGLFPANYVETI